MPNTYAAIQAAIANTPATFPSFAFAGDSTSRGINLATWDLAWPIRMASYLAAAGVEVCTDSAFGHPFGVSNVATFDPRVSIGAGWVPFSSTTLGGRFYQNTTTANALSFTPLGQFDTVNIYTLQNTGLATFTLDIDGAVAGAGFASVNGAGTGAVAKTTLTATKGLHTVNMIRTSVDASGAYLIGWDAYDSSKCQLRILNTAAGSTRSSDWGTSGTSAPGGGLLKVAPQATFGDIGINNWQAGTALATFESQMQTLITNAKVSGDYISIVPNPTGDPAAVGDQLIYMSSIRQLAASNNTALVDMSALAKSYSAMQAKGWMTDYLHPTAEWHDYFGQFMAQRLLGL